jgi:arylsulfatase A-like enzyme
VKWTGHIPAGRTYDHPVIALDILPTLLAAAGGKAPDGVTFDGVNLVPFLNSDGQTPAHDALFWRYGPQLAIRKGDWKYIRRQQEGEQLYNLKTDIGEKQNLFAEKPDVADDLKKTYAKWNAELADPLWKRAGEPRK